MSHSDDTPKKPVPPKRPANPRPRQPATPQSPPATPPPSATPPPAAPSPLPPVTPSSTPPGSSRRPNAARPASPPAVPPIARPLPPADPATPSTGPVLARLGGEATDSGLSLGQPVSTPGPVPPAQQPGPVAPLPSYRKEAAGEPEELEDRLILPAGAWLALRHSGGLRFTSRELTIFDDGRVTCTSTDPLRAAGSLPPLTSAQQSELLQLARQANLATQRTAPLPARPDSYVYELAVRLGKTTHEVELPANRLPTTLRPLIEWLGRLL